MNYFTDVEPGQRWQAEPAERYNAVNALLADRGVLGSFPAAPAIPQHCSVQVCNNGEADIAPFTPVAITGLNGSECDPHYTAFNGRRATAGDEVWGVAQEFIPSHGCGEVLFTGITQIIVAPGTKKSFVKVVENGLAYDDTGRGQVLWGNNTGNAVILLGGGGGGSAVTDNEYRGQFKLSWLNLETRLLQIIDGRYPQHQYCGYTDIPGCHEIGVVHLTVPQNCLIVFDFNWDPANEVYTTRIRALQNDAGGRSAVLGRVKGDDLYQVYDSTNSLIFGNRYFL